MRDFFKLLFWCNLWAIVWIITYPFKPLRQNQNCLTWALQQWSSNGGYLVIRWSRSNMISWIRWPHFLWLDSVNHQQLEHFLPIDDKPIKHLIPDIWFQGSVHISDDDDIEN